MNAVAIIILGLIAAALLMAFTYYLPRVVNRLFKRGMDAPIIAPPAWRDIVLMIAAITAIAGLAVIAAPLT